MVMKTGFRYDAPSHFKLRLENFNLFQAKIDRYESEAFEVAGYKWKLVVYPNGHVRHGAAGNLSMYLAMAGENILPKGWDVKVCFKMFVYDFIKDQYYTAEDDDRVWRFHETKKEWGFDKVLPVDDDMYVKGYLSEDGTCIFGVEIFVVKYEGKGESVTPVDNIKENLFSWSVPKFMELDGEPQFSNVFVTGGHKWKLTLHPKGDAIARDINLSLHLNLVDGTTPLGKSMIVQYKMRITNKTWYDSIEKKDSFMFSSAATSHGVSDLISLKKINKASKGFLWDDKIIVECQLLAIFLVQDFS